MKISKTLRVLFVGASLLLAAGPLRPAWAWISTAFDTSANVMVSSYPTVSSSFTATTVLSAYQGPYATVEFWCYQSNLAGEKVFVSTSLTGFSVSPTTGTARINCTVGTAAPEHLTFTDYTGPLFMVTPSTYPIAVQVIRRK